VHTKYDDIAEQYQRSKHVSWRYYIEQYSFINIIGDIDGLSVVDLACGEGHYTRLLTALGAVSVVGVDISQRMIDLAMAAESAKPMGIDYRVGDACSLDLDSKFDLVTAAYLLNYARDRIELLNMCRSIARYLKPGGRFVTVNNNPAQQVAQFGATQKYGFVKLADDTISDGTAIRYRFFLGEQTFEIENYHLAIETHDWALREAGLTEIAWRPVQLAPAQASSPEQDHWRDFFLDPPVVLLEARKPA